jgi:UDP-N-acetylglucosamine 1-carboxyvinyltransferase
MDKIVVSGGRQLSGEIGVSGAKNAALPLLAASLLARGEHLFRNVPDLVDVSTMLKVLRTMGCTAERLDGRQHHSCRVVVGDVNPQAPYELVKTMRASVLVLGPLVARHGRARVSLPGGCAIGSKAIVPPRNRLAFDLVTVTGTENLMMAAALAEGNTLLENAAREPEVEELARVLNKMGARISGAGSDTISIEGVDQLGPVDHAIIPDRIEAGTLLVASAITQGDVLVKNAQPEHLDAVIQKLREAGCEITSENQGLRCKGPKVIHSVDVKTTAYPGFPTDMQAQLMVLMSVADSTAVISENIFENRFMHVPELDRMGADISIQGNSAVVRGVKRLSGAPVMATDLRASASLILAALRAEGRTDIQRVYHLDRGYEQLDKKLRLLGADIRRFKEK